MKNLKFDMKLGQETTKRESSCCASQNTPGGTPLQLNINKASSCSQPQREKPDWVSGTIATPVGRVSQVLTDWKWTDYWGRIKSRVSAYRMKYAVNPGLYAVGRPNTESDVFISANYKLSFDILRRSLKGMNAWILVLDTKSINVWCAAGKSTFGTEELVKRIALSQLDKVINHKRIIVPQLGGPGINARAVRQRTGFRVFFGPVDARDISAYVEANYTATEEMRTIKFTMLDRLVLTPMEINPAMKKFPLYALIVLLIFGLQPAGILFSDAWSGALPFLLLGLISIFAGAFVTPVLLPFIPFRSFALKGLIVGVLVVSLSMHLFGMLDHENMILVIFAYLFYPLVSSYIGLQFTGSTTFTSMSGVKKELKVSIPVYVVSTVISGLLLFAYKLDQWGVV